MSLEKYLEALDKGTTFTDVVSESTELNEESSDMDGAYWTAKLKVEKEKLRKRGMVDQANNLSMKDIMDKNSFKVTAKKDKFDFKTGKHFKEEVEQIDESAWDEKHPDEGTVQARIKQGYGNGWYKSKHSDDTNVVKHDGTYYRTGMTRAKSLSNLLHAIDSDAKKKKQYNVKEEVDRIDEISKDTLASYKKKAVSTVRDLKTDVEDDTGDRDLAKLQHDSRPEHREKYRRYAKMQSNLDKSTQKLEKRKQGIKTATKKLKEELEQIDEMRSPFHKAATELEKHAKKLGPKHMDHDDFMNHAKALKQYDPSEWRHSAQSLKNLDTGARDTVLDHIHKHTAKKDMSAAYHKASGHTRIAEESLEEVVSPADKEILRFISKHARPHLEKSKEDARKHGGEKAAKNVEHGYRSILKRDYKKADKDIAEETLEEGSWTDERSCYDGPGKGKELTKMSEKEHADAINHHKTQMHQLNTGTHKYSKMYDKQEKQDKYHYHAHKASLHKDALDHHQMYNEEKDTSALDAMDAKEKRKDKIRQYIKNQSPVKIKRVPGKPEVKEELELTESSDFHAKPTASGAKHYALVDYDNDKKSGYGTRKDGHKYVGMAGYQKGDDTHKPNSSNLRKSGLIVKHKDTGKYAVGNISAKTEWHDTVEHATANAHKRFRMDHQHVTPDHVKTISSLDYRNHVNKPVNEAFDDSYTKNLPTWKLKDLKKAREGMKNADDYKKAEAEELKKRNVKEELELDEAVKFEHDRVIRAHGKKNPHTDYALWMFTHKRTGDVDYDNEKECHQVSATRKDAQKSATEWANKHGHKTVYFMESIELDEAANIEKKKASLEKKLEDKRAALSRATAARKHKGQHLQNSREIQLHSDISKLYGEIRILS